MDIQAFSPAETQKAPEVIYSQIYQRIISGKLKPGDRLPSERALAEQFHRSRHIIREALLMLQQDGLLTIEVGSTGGAVIQGVSINMLASPLKRYLESGDLSLLELTEYRYLNELGCVRFAARHRIFRPCSKHLTVSRQVWTMRRLSWSTMWIFTVLWQQPAITDWLLWSTMQ